MENKLRNLIEDYLNEAKLMQVATSKDNRPWACSVYFAFDKDLNLYWISTPTRRHSMEINDNENVAGTIVLPHTPGDAARGIQFEGSAKKLTNKTEIFFGMKCYVKRFGMSKERMNEIIEGKDAHVCYKIAPKLYVLFDEVNFPDQSRREYKL